MTAVRRPRRPVAAVVMVLAAVVLAAALVAFLGWLWSRPAVPAPAAAVTVADPTAGPQLAGQVVEGLTGRGIPGAAVTVQCAGGFARAVVADDAGRYAVAKAPAGECMLRATAAGYVAGARGGDKPLVVAVPGGAAAVSVRGPVLFAAATVVGTVVSATGTVPGARLSLLYMRAPGEAEPFTLAVDTASDRDGRFLLKNLGPGTVQVLAEVPGYALGESAAVDLPSGETRTVTVALRGGAAITGVVVDAFATPLAAIHVRLAGSKHGSTTSDRLGEFTFADLGPGNYIVRAEAAGRSGPPVQVNGLDEGDAVPVRLTLAATPGIYGVVLARTASAPDGTPVAGAAVLAFPRATAATAGIPTPPEELGDIVGQTTSADDGTFFLPAPNGATALTLQAFHRAHAPSSSVVADVTADPAAAATPVVLTLQAGARIIGRLVSGPGGPEAFGEPLPDAAALVFTSGAPDKPGRRARRGDSPGRFAAEGLVAGSYDVTMVASGRIPVGRRGVVVAEGETVDLGDVPLEAGGTLIGEVRDASGAPLAGVSLRALTAHDTFPFEAAPITRTCSRGRFRLGPMPAAAATVHVQKLGYVTEDLAGITVALGAELTHPVITLRERTDLALAPAPDARGGSGGDPADLAPPLVAFAPRLSGLTVTEGAEAHVPGLTPGARLVSVAGYAVADLKAAELRRLLFGPPGSEAEVEVLLPDATTPTAFRIPRGAAP